MFGTKVLFIIRQAEFGGGETHLNYIFDSIDRKFFIPILASLSEGYLSDYAKSIGIKFYLLSKRNLDFFKNIFSLIQIIKKEKIKFIHAHGTKGAALALVPSIFTKRKMIYTVHSWSFHPQLNKFQIWLRKFIEKLICTYAAKVILVSKTDFEVGDFVSAEKKVLIPNGVDLLNFQPFRNEKLREELGYSEQDFVIGYFARFTHQKNPFFALKLIKALEVDDKKINKKFKLLMIGDGELKNAIFDYIKRENLEKFVRVLEPTYEIENFLNVIDCYLLPSYWEGLPYGILEAMSCGIPVVASDIPNIREIIETGKNGFCLQTDVNKFKDVIVQLAENSQLYDQIRKESRKTIEIKFNLETSIVELIKIYERFKIYERD